jgi:hypothetical protein
VKCSTRPAVPSLSLPGRISREIARPVASTMGWTASLLSLLIFVLALFHGTLANAELRYIDDNDKSGVSYSPPNQWLYGPTCTTCYTAKYASIDPSDVYGGSWHETTFMLGDSSPSITLTFMGEKSNNTYPRKG